MIASMLIFDSSRRRVISLKLPSRPLTFMCASFSRAFPNAVFRFSSMSGCDTVKVVSEGSIVELMM